jgi:hypothetical protein
MRRRHLTGLLIVPALALAACGSGKQVDTAKYTCGEFNKSLATKGDNTSGNYVNKLRAEAQLGQGKKIEQREISLGVYFACRGKPAGTRPHVQAIGIAKDIKAGRFRLPGMPAQPKKKSGK